MYEAYNTMGLDTNFANAEKAVEAMILKTEIVKGGHTQVCDSEKKEEGQ